MSVRNKPNYQLYALNLGLANGAGGTSGYQDIPAIGTRIALVTAISGATFLRNASGEQILNGGTSVPQPFLSVQIGKAEGDPIPLGPNTKINVDDAFEFCRFTWPVQAGVTAIVLIADDRAGSGIFIDAPASVLGGSIAIQSAGQTAAVEASSGNYDGNALRVSVSQKGSDALTKLGASKSVGASGSTAVTTLLAPASNTNGCWLRTAHVSANAAGALTQIYCDTAAPSGTDDTTKAQLLDSGPGGETELPYPVFLPPGVGIFVAALISASTARWNATWDLM